MRIEPFARLRVPVCAYFQQACYEPCFAAAIIPCCDESQYRCYRQLLENATWGHGPQIVSASRI